MKRIIVWSFLFYIIISGGCTKNRIYEKHINIENYSWKRIDGNHVLKYEVPVKDTSSNYNIMIAVRYMTGFPFTTLHVGFDIYTPDGEEKYSLHNLAIRGKDGSNKGEGLGDIWDLNVPVITNYKFNTKGLYKFEIENLMDKYDTPGIMQIGLIIEKAKSRE
jgi:gliding motility-associated lipoprotein GldH